MRVPGIPFVQGRNVYPDRDGLKYGIAIHATANTATAEQEASYATRRTDGVSAHFYVDSDSIVQSLDTDVRAGHAGSGTGNENAIAIEITGLAGSSRQWWLANVAWGRLATVLATLCRHHGVAVRRATVAEMVANPRVRAFYGHNDMRLAWGGTTHTDPGPNFPWDHLLATVASALDSEDDMTPAQFLAILQDPAVARAMRALPWQYDGRGIPPNYNTLNVLNETLENTRALVGRNVSEEVVRAVLTALSPEAIAAAVPPDLAKKLADELAARLAVT
ncbi:peptidoglycan recognition family protein [Micromonospora sp. WMMD882]|uniref:peptidoglycan recognition protein family protein n=1 Tax=Micromonospora sp. WMMD882 TaxID=3015151 RepID=UPI00248AB22D|nr:peptidoglycan recognition family protein [Micromonospora sp. WMMD882]WBB78949.1 peptidoglycan recognition family protein [Micromonospora sp. WMMD882]